MNDDACFASATELAARVRTGDVSPVEVTRAVLDRIERHDRRVNAFAHLAPELALDMAKAAEKRRGPGRRPRPAAMASP